MARKHKSSSEQAVKDFRHAEAQRKNNPPAGIAPTYEVGERRTKRYEYDPHLDPQLQWSGKAEHTAFEVDLVSLHIHERISTSAILRAVRQAEPVQLDLFGETPLSADQELQFYQHEVGWANRLILGDSLLVMNSLLVKEGMAGKVQMIYVDPPYGIKYASNFQPRIDRRDVKDKDEDLTHEPEQIKAYRDTWTLGIHSYLTYLRDRLFLCRELLHESGSIFVQINDENLHLVRCLLDEVFGRENFVAVVSFVKTSGFESTTLSRAGDYLLWYAKKVQEIKYRQLYWDKTQETSGYNKMLEGKSYSSGALFSPGKTEEGSKAFEFQGRKFTPSGGHWKTNFEGLRRLSDAERIEISGRTLRYIRYLDDFNLIPINNIWDDTQTFAEKLYAVQTNTKVVERCILMTTDPGDLVFDPTCGSGTTAYCAEKWGRRWITCDTSRVALAIARQRLMTAKFDYYELRDPGRGPAGGFIYETVPHITLESIAKNTEIDNIAAKYQPQIDQALADLNNVLVGTHGRAPLQEWEVPREVPDPVWPQEAQEAYKKLYEAKRKALSVGKSQLEDWLQTVYRLTGHRWKSIADVPDPVPTEGWPEEAKAVLHRFWELKRCKRKEIDESIQRNAPQETLYDQPTKVRGVVRVSGPFTVEAIPVPAVEDPTQVPIPQFEEQEARGRIADRGGDYLTDMINLLKQQGRVLFPGGKKLELENLRPLNLGYLHAEAEAQQNGKTLRVAVSFGPQYGPVIAHQVQEAIPTARMNGYQILIFAGFAFDPEAQSLIQKVPVEGLKVHLVNIASDVLVGDLLKTTRASQIFTVFGQPDVNVIPQKDGTYVVNLLGVDIYDPLTGEAHSTRGEDVAAWFLDTDYDGKTFHICQAFFPGDSDAWEKLQRALRAQIDPETFEKMRGTASFPFQLGEHKRIAVKVIDFRGNEVVRVVNPQQEGATYHG
ncbi:site-specific DNA-methyltransferase [Candidatus Methylacidiphilum infernorum]|uniref:site-specific DNA-methyltransferase (adenine-specific) n=1 Tax=Candidatus Methylacidiphilum infernorum TaxID=511746 RepID=A0ABX7PXA8_9BACT|nr:site-specific DNA-methyltransferase [Candidatus Methylacidiphilum infernorum]QSR87650.1 site-specific DNA-methyltransferase [Candidatus Methylacidiphilum infernorum]